MKIKNLFELNQKKLILLLFCFMIFSLLPNLPYLNLYLKPYFFLPFLLIISIFIFQISSGFLAKTALILFLLCLILVLLKAENEAGAVGNLIYALLFLGVIQGIVIFLKK